MGAPTEISAATILITFWDDNVSGLSTDQTCNHSNAHSILQPSHAPADIAAILVVMISFNLIGVRYFGESEFCFCLIKREPFMPGSL